MDRAKSKSLFVALQHVAMLVVCYVMLAWPGLTTDEKAAEAVRNVERRSAAQKPAWPQNVTQWLEYPAKLEAYLKDHHGFRTKAIRWNSLARLRLGESSSDRVVIGRSGFLYYDGDKKFLDLERAIPLDTKVRDARLRVWMAWAKWMDSRGAKFLIAPIPTKGIIYPEHLPSSVSRYLPTDRNEVFFTALGSMGLSVANVRAGIREIAATEKHLLYYKTDSHYNNLGAYYTYREIMKSVAAFWPDADANTVKNVKVVPGGKRTTDLANLLYLAKDFEENDVQALVAEPVKLETWDSKGPDGRGYRHCRTAERKGPRLLIFHDSFGWDLRRFFCQSFPEVLMVHHDFKGPYKAPVESFKPDLVIFELAEYGFLGEFAMP
ncbi:MAG: hypothetical protein IPM54_27145 [Polyangiaceae bacterium]|nr:hypothetical protein [Polyangiaceae bacterium]